LIPRWGLPGRLGSRRRAVWAHGGADNQPRSGLTEEQTTNISAAQHSNTVRATISNQCQTDRQWEVWGLVAEGTGVTEEGKIRFTVDSKKTSFYSDTVMSYPQLIVWALEMRRMMGISVLESVIGRLEETWVAQQTRRVFEEAVTYWRKQLL
jgi:hypothetical protein